MDHVGLVRTVAVLDYVGGHFELEQSDMEGGKDSGKKHTDRTELTIG